MKNHIYSFIIILLIIIFLSICSCEVKYSNELYIPLPGKYKGEQIELGETSSCEISINSNGELVPSKINAIYWNTNVIIARINPLKNDEPNYNITEWYILDLTISKKYRYLTKAQYKEKLYELGLNEISIKLMGLYEAKKKREKELGIKLSGKSESEYITKCWQEDF